MKDARISLARGREPAVRLLDVQRDTGEEFIIDSEQGRGGSCIVYRAALRLNGRIDRPVLLKEFYPQVFSACLDREEGSLALAFKPEADGELRCAYARERERFMENCRQQKRFYRENAPSSADELIEIQGEYRLGEGYYVVMTAGSGSSWDQLPQRGAGESLHDILETIKSVVREAALYHESGLLHCDIKPENIYVFQKTRQHVRLLDFGSVQQLNGGCLSGRELLSYSTRYAAPEILDTRDISDVDRGDYYSCIGERADLYSIAAVLYERLTGEARTPEQTDDAFLQDLGDSLDMLWMRERNGWLKNIRHTVILELKAFLGRALSWNPDERFDSEEMAKRLDALMALSRPQEIELSDECRVQGGRAGFIGRRDELRSLKLLLRRETGPIYIWGEGGLGKSEIALQLAREAAQDYDFYRVTFSADLEQTISSLPVRPRLHLEEGDSEAAEARIRARREQYNWNLRCLKSYGATNVLIVDNFDVPPERENEIFHSEAYAQLASMDMRVIFTTRRQPPEGAAQLELKALNDAELTKVFRLHFRGEAEDGALRELIAGTCGNTLLVELAAKTLEQSWGRLGMREMLDVFSSARKGEEAVCEGIRRLFNLSLLNNASRKLMAQAGIFPTGGINAALCLACHSEAEQDKLRLLELNGWIHKTPENLLVVHPLVQKVCRELPRRDSACLKFLQEYEKQFYSLSRQQRLDNQLQYVELISNAADFLRDRQGRYAALAGELNYDAGRYRDALKYNQKYWDIYLKRDQVESAGAMDIIDRIACCCLALGRYAEAVHYEEQGIGLFEKFEGGDHPSLAVYYENLGSMCKESGDYQRAILHYLRSQELYEKRDPDMNVQKAHLYVNLCKLCEQIGNLEKAREYGRTALEFLEGCGADAFLELRASACTTLGILEEHAGNFEAALDCYDRAIAAYGSLYGEEHPHMASSLNDRGVALTYMGRYAQALKDLEKSLKIKEKIHGPSHPHVATACHGLADAYRRMEDYPRAREFCGRAEEIRKRFYGPYSVKTAPSYNLRAALAHGEGEREEALKYSALTFLIYYHAPENNYRSDLNQPYMNPEIRRSLENLHMCYVNAGMEPQCFEDWLLNESFKFKNGLL